MSTTYEDKRGDYQLYIEPSADHDDDRFEITIAREGAKGEWLEVACFDAWGYENAVTEGTKKLTQLAGE